MIQVFLVKRYKRKHQRNGKREYRSALRWEAPDGWRCESTGTADRTQAEALQKQKWAELNIPEARPEEPAPEPVKPSWDECKEALKRAMEADNLRPSYVHEAQLLFDRCKRMFPEAKTPADITPAIANEYKRRRAGEELSSWSVKSDLATLRAVFGKWLGQELSLLPFNPFANVRPPKCDDPDVRIVSAKENAALFKWLRDRWARWELPLVYLQAVALLGWRATETASLREDDLLPDGFVRVAAENCKTRRQKFGWLPADLYADVKACASGGWVFGSFSDELRRRLILCRKQPNHAARVKAFSPNRLVGWLQDEFERYNAEKDGEPFTLHDYRRTAITALQMSGVSEKETSLMVGASPRVIQKHYARLDACAIAKRSTKRRLEMEASANPEAPTIARLLRAGDETPLDERKNAAQTVGA